MLYSAQHAPKIISDKLNKKGFNIEYNQNVINGLIDRGIDTETIGLLGSTRSTIQYFHGDIDRYRFWGSNIL